MAERASLWRSVLFLLPKTGDNPSDCQDAGCVRDEFGRAAISDGATEAYMSGLWADALVRHACESGPPTRESLSTWLAKPQQACMSKRRVMALDPSLPWHVKDLSRVGAATLLYFDIERDHGTSELRWRALAVGDSCLFHMRRRELLQAFPLAEASAFDDQPACLPSGPVAKPLPELWEISGIAAPSDVFVLATDAVAQWLLERSATVQLWEAIEAIATEEDFRRLIERERATKRMKNDDACLLVLHVVPHAPSRVGRSTVGDAAGRALAIDPARDRRHPPAPGDSTVRSGAGSQALPPRGRTPTEVPGRRGSSTDPGPHLRRSENHARRTTARTNRRLRSDRAWQTAAPRSTFIAVIVSLLVSLLVNLMWPSRDSSPGVIAPNVHKPGATTAPPGPSFAGDGGASEAPEPPTDSSTSDAVVHATAPEIAGGE